MTISILFRPWRKIDIFREENGVFKMDRCRRRSLSDAMRASNSRQWRLVEINIDDFSAVWPIGRVRDETGAYRIVLYIIPFLRITFSASQNVIEESTLPDWILRISRSYLSREYSL